MEWDWSYRRASGPGCDIVYVLDSDVLQSAHMAVTACSNVVKKYFQLKKFYCINLLTCVAKIIINIESL